MARRNRSAFTLVELLVVIVIISMLVGMLVPAVIRSRENGRRAQCLNNQRELSLATLQYETAIGHFPGYLNKMGTGPVVEMAGNRQLPLSWATVLFPHLDKGDLWKQWRTLDTNTYSASLATIAVRVPQLVCPSDFTKPQGPALSYVANCGIQDGTNNDLAKNAPRAENASDGVFHNLYGVKVSGNWVTYTTPSVSASNIKDGASNTLLIAENVQAGVWYADPNAAVVEAYLGFVWRWTGTGGAAADTLKINQDRESTPPALPDGYKYARPSSNHPGGVMVSYCDGRQQFLSENINYDTLRHLMTPDSVDSLFAVGGGVYVPDPELKE